MYIVCFSYKTHTFTLCVNCYTCTKMDIDRNQKCLIFAGETLAYKAEKLCQNLEGELPVPMNEQENTDYFNAFHKLNSYVRMSPPVVTEPSLA